MCLRHGLAAMFMLLVETLFWNQRLELTPCYAQSWPCHGMSSHQRSFETDLEVPHVRQTVVLKGALLHVFGRCLHEFFSV